MSGNNKAPPLSPTALASRIRRPISSPTNSDGASVTSGGSRRVHRPATEEGDRVFGQISSSTGVAMRRSPHPPRSASVDALLHTTDDTISAVRSRMSSPRRGSAPAPPTLPSLSSRARTPEPPRATSTEELLHNLEQTAHNLTKNVPYTSSSYNKKEPAYTSGYGRDPDGNRVDPMDMGEYPVSSFQSDMPSYGDEPTPSNFDDYLRKPSASPVPSYGENADDSLRKRVSFDYQLNQDETPSPVPSYGDGARMEPPSPVPSYGDNMMAHPQDGLRGNLTMESVPEEPVQSMLTMETEDSHRELMTMPTEDTHREIQAIPTEDTRGEDYVSQSEESDESNDSVQEVEEQDDEDEEIVSQRSSGEEVIRLHSMVSPTSTAGKEDDEEEVASDTEEMEVIKLHSMVTRDDEEVEDDDDAKSIKLDAIPSYTDDDKSYADYLRERVSKSETNEAPHSFVEDVSMKNSMVPHEDSMPAVHTMTSDDHVDQHLNEPTFSELTDPRATPSFQQSQDPAIQSLGSTVTEGSEARANLDLKNNDNAFHVLANLLVDFYQSKIVVGENKVRLTRADRDHMSRLLPSSARAKFIDAVRYRLRSTPREPTKPLEFLTRQCERFGLDREENDNPILAGVSMTSDTIEVAILPDQQRLGQSRGSSSWADEPTQSKSEPKKSFPEAPRVEEASSDEQTGDGSDGTTPLLLSKSQNSKNSTKPTKPPLSHTPVLAAKETLSTAFVSKAMTGKSPYGLPAGDNQSQDPSNATSSETQQKQQLIAELREASRLMTESVTPETCKFWKGHVMDLQSRLRELLGEPEVLSATKSPSTEEILEANRCLLNKYDKRGDPYPTYGKTKSAEKSPSKLVMKSEYESPFVDVVAPADLPGGYVFEAELNGERFMATVPTGGIREGETFTCVMRELKSFSVDVPAGYWKDDLHEFMKHGCCHAVLWNALVCPLVAVAQVATRLELDFLGRPLTAPRMMHNRSMVLLITGFWLAMNMFLFMGYNYKWSQNLELSVPDLAACGMVNVAFWCYIVFVTQSTRYSLRQKFMIREEQCYDLEDLCCATFCLPCTVSQMSRHTADYDNYEAVCCSKNGLPDGVTVSLEQTEGQQYVV